MPALTASVSLSYVAGDDITLEFAVTDEDGVAANILGCTPRFAVARRHGQTAVITTEGDTPTATAAVTSAASGLFRVTVDAANTEDLRGTYVFQAELEDASGDKATVASGFITWTPSLV